MAITYNIESVALRRFCEEQRGRSGVSFRGIIRRRLNGFGYPVWFVQIQMLRPDLNGRRDLLAYNALPTHADAIAWVDQALTMPPTSPTTNPHTEGERRNQ